MCLDAGRIGDERRFVGLARAIPVGLFEVAADRVPVFRRQGSRGGSRRGRERSTSTSSRTGTAAGSWPRSAFGRWPGRRSPCRCAGARSARGRATPATRCAAPRPGCGDWGRTRWPGSCRPSRTSRAPWGGWRSVLPSTCGCSNSGRRRPISRHAPPSGRTLDQRTSWGQVHGGAGSRKLNDIRPAPAVARCPLPGV